MTQDSLAAYATYIKKKKKLHMEELSLSVLKVNAQQKEEEGGIMQVTDFLLILYEAAIYRRLRSKCLKLYYICYQETQVMKVF